MRPPTKFPQDNIFSSVYLYPMRPIPIILLVSHWSEGGLQPWALSQPRTHMGPLLLWTGPDLFKLKAGVGIEGHRNGHSERTWGHVGICLLHLSAIGLWLKGIHVILWYYLITFQWLRNNSIYWLKSLFFTYKFSIFLFNSTAFCETEISVDTNNLVRSLHRNSVPVWSEWNLSPVSRLPLLPYWPQSLLLDLHPEPCRMSSCHCIRRRPNIQLWV